MTLRVYGSGANGVEAIVWEGYDGRGNGACMGRLAMGMRASLCKDRDGRVWEDRDGRGSELMLGQ